MQKSWQLLTIKQRQKKIDSLGKQPKAIAAASDQVPTSSLLYSAARYCKGFGVGLDRETDSSDSVKKVYFQGSCWG